MNRKKGSVLIIILWSLLFLAMLAVAINSYIWPQLEFSGRFLNNAKMYYLARAGVERAILEAENDQTSSYDSLSDSWSVKDEAFKNVPLGEGMFSAVKPAAADDTEPQYGLTDEESKININKATAAVLKNLFEKEAGIEAEEAGAIADSILDWRDKDDSLHKDGCEDDYYQGLSDPYHCKNGYFEAPEELLLVSGVTRESFDKIKDMITIYGDGTVNVNTASARVLVALGMDEGTAEKIVSFRNVRSLGDEGDTPSNVFTDASTIADVIGKSEDLSGDEAGQLQAAVSMLGVKSDNFRGVIRGTLSAAAGKAARITFVYDRNEGIVKHWREE